MEFALEVWAYNRNTNLRFSFNPCYYGIRFRRGTIIFIALLFSGFNPCYYGIRFRSRKSTPGLSQAKAVSILVIMELALEALSL